MKKRILLVEDDKFLRTIIERRLQAEGFEIDSAVDGEEATEKLLKPSYDLILLDIILPKKNGFEVLKDIHKDPNLSKIPVIILSNLGQEEDIERSKALGVLNYFVKASTSIDQLVETIKKLP